MGSNFKEEKEPLLKTTRERKFQSDKLHVMIFFFSFKLRIAKEYKREWMEFSGENSRR